MADLIIFAAFLSFVVFLIAGKYRKFAAVSGWCCIILNLWSELPAFISENNFLYPLLSLFALPFLIITTDRLFHEDPAVLRLSRTAAIATVIWAPFALVPLIGNWLIAIMVTLVVHVITALGHHPQLFAWDVIAENGFYNQIILSCTGILAMAMMLGIVFGEAGLSFRQAVRAFMFIVPMIFLLNLLRVAAVFIAVSDRWFAGFPDPTGTGDANFFWAHNVIAEGLALIFLFSLIWLLTRLIPVLGISAADIARSYRTAIFRIRARDSEIRDL